MNKMGQWMKLLIKIKIDQQKFQYRSWLISPTGPHKHVFSYALKATLLKKKYFFLQLGHSCFSGSWSGPQMVFYRPLICLTYQGPVL
jgi:hypothetical protein